MGVSTVPDGSQWDTRDGRDRKVGTGTIVDELLNTEEGNLVMLCYWVRNKGKGDGLMRYQARAKFVCDE